MVGLIVGAVATRIGRGRDPGGLIVSVMIGIAGALLAGYLAQAGGIRVGRGQLGAAALGSVVLLLVYRAVMVRRSR